MSSNVVPAAASQPPPSTNATGAAGVPPPLPLQQQPTTSGAQPGGTTAAPSSTPKLPATPTSLNPPRSLRSAADSVFRQSPPPAGAASIQPHNSLPEMSAERLPKAQLSWERGRQIALQFYLCYAPDAIMVLPEVVKTAVDKGATEDDFYAELANRFRQAPQAGEAARVFQSDRRTRLIAFFAFYRPSRIKEVDAILDKYHGLDDELWKALTNKYGQEPLVAELFKPDRVDADRLGVRHREQQGGEGPTGTVGGAAPAAGGSDGGVPTADGSNKALMLPSGAAVASVDRDDNLPYHRLVMKVLGASTTGAADLFPSARAASDRRREYTGGMVLPGIRAQDMDRL